MPLLVRRTIQPGRNNWSKKPSSGSMVALLRHVMQTAVVRLYTLGGQYSSDWGEIMGDRDPHRRPGPGLLPANATSFHRRHGQRIGQRLKRCPGLKAGLIGRI